MHAVNLPRVGYNSAMQDPTVAANQETQPSQESAARRPYHHGDLRHALVETAVALARAEGPDAVVLREVARRTGVSPTAAYRHFADHAALVDAVKHAAIDELSAWMRSDLVLADQTDSLPGAQARLRAIMTAYIRFALAEPGLFRVAFDRRDGPPPPYVGEWQATAYALLASAVDDLVRHGGLPAERRPHSEIAIWSAGHGFASLLNDGLLRGMPDAERADALDRLIDIMLRGL